MDLESHPTTLQKENRNKVYELLKNTHSRIEKLIQKTYQQKDVAATSQLRQLRTRITGLISEAKKKNLTPSEVIPATLMSSMRTKKDS